MSARGAEPAARSDPPPAVASRRALITMITRRQRPGSGSDLDRLMQQERTSMRWWQDVHGALAEIPHAVIGAVAANRYMPPRQTADIDVAVRLVDLHAAQEAMRRAGWAKSRRLAMGGGLEGSAWVDGSGNELDLIGIPGDLGDETVDGAQDNAVDGIPYSRLPHLVVLKMLSSRSQDIADLTRLLGMAGGVQLSEVREAVRRFGAAEDVEDLGQLVAAGKLERSDPAF